MMEHDEDDPASSYSDICHITGPDCENDESSQTLTGMSSQSSVPESQSQSLHLQVDVTPIVVVDDSEFEPNSQNTSSPKPKPKKFIHRKQPLEEPPLTAEQIRADSRYNVRELFKLRIIKDKDVSYYQCLSCLPADKLVWTSKTGPYSHMKKHLLSMHTAEIQARFEVLKDKKGGNKRPSSPSSESSASVSKKARPASNSNDPLHLRLSSQKDFEQDTLLEVVHNMLSFQVIIFII